MTSIGSVRPRASHIFQHFGLAPFRVILPPDEFAAAARRAGCEPQRRRPLIPEVVAWLMMYVGLTTQSMTQGITQAWGLVRAICPGLKDTCVTEEAFSQARKQLTHGFWRSLFNRLCRQYEEKFTPRMLWKNKFRVLAVDGSEVDLPNVPDLVGFFGRPKNGKGGSKTPQGRLVAMCSVFTGFCLAFKFVSLRFTEHAALRHLIRRLRRDDIALMDRGFFSLRRRGTDSLVRGAVPDTRLRTGGRLRPAT
jgi:hypothetical protein